MRARARLFLLASVWTAPVALSAQEWQATAHTGRIRSASRRPLSVNGISVVPVCCPLTLHAVSP